MLQEYIATLCQTLGIPPAAPDSSGVWRVLLPDGIAITIAPRRDATLFFGTLCVLPEHEAAANTLCRKLLDTALCRTLKECKTALPFLSVQDTLVVLNCQLPVAASQVEFADAVEFFANLLETWTRIAKNETGKQVFMPGNTPLNAIVP